MARDFKNPPDERGRQSMAQREKGANNGFIFNPQAAVASASSTECSPCLDAAELGNRHAELLAHARVGADARADGARGPCARTVRADGRHGTSWRRSNLSFDQIILNKAHNKNYPSKTLTKQFAVSKLSWFCEFNSTNVALHI